MKPTWKINLSSLTNFPQIEEATWLSSENIQYLRFSPLNRLQAFWHLLLLSAKIYHICAFLWKRCVLFMASICVCVHGYMRENIHFHFFFCTVCVGEDMGTYCCALNCLHAQCVRRCGGKLLDRDGLKKMQPSVPTFWLFNRVYMCVCIKLSYPLMYLCVSDREPQHTTANSDWRCCRHCSRCCGPSLSCKL